MAAPLDAEPKGMQEFRAWKNYPVKFHDPRLSNLSRREDSRHIFICPLVVMVVVVGATRKRVSALRERERERGGEEADTRFNRRYTDDNNGENSRYSEKGKGKKDKREKKKSATGGREKEEGEESRRVVDGLGGCASNKFPAWIMYRSP